MNLQHVASAARSDESAEPATAETTAAPPSAHATSAHATSAHATSAHAASAEPARQTVPSARAEPQALIALAPTAAAVESEASPVARIDKLPSSRTPAERAQTQYQRGLAAQSQGLTDNAAQAYLAALREEPRFAPARQALAGIRIGQGRQDEAAALLREGVALTPHDPGLAMLAARVFADRGALQDAEAVLEAAAIASPDAQDLAFRAAVLQRLARHADAAALYAAALRVSPGEGVWWMGLGMSLAAEGRNVGAREAFGRARATGRLAPELDQYVAQRLRSLK